MPTRNNEISATIKNEIMKLTEIVFDQNYFQFNSIQLKQTGLTMGAPTSAIFVEIFLHWLEHTQITKILTKHNSNGYFQYVDNVLIVYNPQDTIIENTLADINSLHPNLKFTIQEETNSTLNYLDLHITNVHGQLEYKVYRKPTATDVIIHDSSCHPFEHKISALCTIHHH
jgi:hypothetical protein